MYQLGGQMFQHGHFTSKIARSISSSQLYRLCEKDSVNALANYGFSSRTSVSSRGEYLLRDFCVLRASRPSVAVSLYGYAYVQ